MRVTVSSTNRPATSSFSVILTLPSASLNAATISFFCRSSRGSVEADLDCTAAVLGDCSTDAPCSARETIPREEVFPFFVTSFAPVDLKPSISALPRSLPSCLKLSFCALILL